MFTLFDNQNGILTLQGNSAADGTGTQTPLPPDLAVLSGNGGVLSVAPVSAPGQFKITAVSPVPAGSPFNVDVTATGTNEAGATVTTVFTFAVSHGGVTLSFVGTFTNVQVNP